MGSTNAYTEDAAGRPKYDWTIVDRIIDTYIERKMKPLVEIGFMPEALSTNPQPYKHDWAPGLPYNRIYTGWTYPPKDYDKWRELIFRVKSTSAAPLETIRDTGVRTAPDIYALAARSGQDVTVLVWNYHDDDVPAAPADVDVILSGMREGSPNVTHYRVDRDHSNSYETWKKMGSPQPPTAAQYSALEKAGKLQTLGSSQRVKSVRGELRVTFPLPRQGVSLLRIAY